MSPPTTYPFPVYSSNFFPMNLAFQIRKLATHIPTRLPLSISSAAFVENALVTTDPRALLPLAPKMSIQLFALYLTFVLVGW